jgi:hypothetical protein
MQTLLESRRMKRKKVPARQLEEFYPSNVGLNRRGDQLPVPLGVADAAVPDPCGLDGQSVQKSVTWFRTSLRRNAQAVDI